MVADRMAEQAVAAAPVVLDRYMAALNARDAAALAATLHFPHYRLSGGRTRVWQEPDAYFADFLARAGEGWLHGAWISHTPIAASAEKVHLDVVSARYRVDTTPLGRFRSLGIAAPLGGRWAAQARSSFAD